jgi:hypothetical protein
MGTHAYHESIQPKDHYYACRSLFALIFMSYEQNLHGLEMLVTRLLPERKVSTFLELHHLELNCVKRS